MLKAIAASAPRLREPEQRPLGIEILDGARSRLVGASIAAEPRPTATARLILSFRACFDPSALVRYA